MAIDLENGMFALHITPKAPPVPTVDGFVGTGTAADPFILTSGGTPVPNARLDASARDVLWNQIRAGSNVLNKALVCAAFGESVGSPYAIFVSDSSGNMKLALNKGLRKASSGALTAVDDAVVFGLTAAESYAALQSGGNYSPDIAIENTGPVAANWRPFVNSAHVPVDIGYLAAEALSVGIAPANLVSLTLLNDALSSATNALIDLSIDWVPVGNTQTAYTLCKITKAAGVAPATGYTVETRVSHDSEPRVASVKPTSSEGYTNISNLTFSEATLDKDKLTAMFPAAGELVYRLNYTGARATQSYMTVDGLNFTGAVAFTFAV